MVSPDLLQNIRADLAKRKGSRVRGTGLAESLADKLSIPVMDVREALSALHERGELKATDWDPRLGPQGMVTLKLEVPDNPANIAWGKAMRIAGLSMDDANVLMPAADVLSDMSETDQVAVAKGLLKLRDCVDKHVGESRYLVSARYLMSSSKMLDALPSTTLKTLSESSTS